METTSQLNLALSNMRIGRQALKNTRLIIRKGREHIILKVEDVVLFYTDNKIVYLLDNTGGKHIYESNLACLQEQLDPSIFFRANRKYIVNIEYIKSYKVFEKVKLTLEFTIPFADHMVIISQENAPVFKNWITGF